MENEVISVGAFTRQVKSLLEDNLPACWIRGEVSNLRRQSSGHTYFTLKDKESQLSCVLFRGDALRQKVPLADGVQVVVYGEVSVYEPRGSYQLICRFVVEDGVGRLQLEFERLKQKLLAEGLFDEAKKQQLPELPLTVGFVTSPTGAAIRDFLSILKRRHWRGRVVVLPAKVQGDGAADEIVTMIEHAQKMNIFDLLVIGRGGGSLEDLWPFNEEAVARAVAGCTIPVISAVGHEIDFTLSDFAADQRAETPSAAAELISSGYLEVIERLRQVSAGMMDAAMDSVDFCQRRLELLHSRLKSVLPQKQVEQAHLRLDDLTNRLHAALHLQQKGKQMQLMELKHALVAVSPENQLKLASYQLKHTQERFRRLLKKAGKEEQQVLNRIEKRLQHNSIQSVLKRGFVVVRDEQGNLVTAKADLKSGAKLSNDFHDGEIVVKIEAV